MGALIVTTSCWLPALATVSYAALLGGLDSMVADNAADTSALSNVLRYRDGPLTPDDFRAEPLDRPAGQNNDWHALTRTDLRFQLRYRLEKRGSVTAAQLEQIDVFAVMLRDQSWNARKQDQQLLSHAQGHFDIMHAAALRSMLMFSELLTSGRPPTGVGDSENAAIRDLDQRIKQLIKPLVDAARQEAESYDRITHHGQQRRELAEARGKQIETIRSLAVQAESAIRD